MRKVLTLWRREMGSGFAVPTAYVVFFIFLGLIGLTFWFLAEPISEGVTAMSVQHDFFNALVFFLMLAAPVLTMRTFAEERRSGTIETLLTAPVSDVSVVMGKYLGVLTQMLLLLGLTGSFFALLRFFDPLSALDVRALVTGYAGVAAIGALYVAVGLLASAMTRSQVVAAIVSFTLLFLLYLTAYVPEWVRGDAVSRWASYCSPLVHLRDFSRGVVDTRALVFYASMTAWFLFATVKRLEARRWA